MRLSRALGGAVLWILASVLGLVGVVLCITVILLPVGIPLLKIAGRLFSTSIQLMLPRAVAHPVNELGKAAKKKNRKIKATASDTVDDTTKRVRKAARKMRKQIA
ncbi:hypothetical protein A5662_27080 [Mycobacteriaceae bacterium 1482268.1]|nr:hypothetical protein A5662_27080 [Mycobacteriaceae bacterium 1482268.1]